MCPISNDGAALSALSAGAFPLQFTAGTLESGPKALGEVTGLACSPGCPGFTLEGYRRRLV